ncbi:unnamed protein product [Brugia timori]|uniref:Uncharacterized protein n=1 Tax=Brugia timori TaxID=42155 RepID=A0A0R3QGB5_9BILA|nr:unnamed protein product [Brugia timori]
MNRFRRVNYNAGSSIPILRSTISLTLLIVFGRSSFWNNLLQSTQSDSIRLTKKKKKETVSNI